MVKVDLPLLRPWLRQYPDWLPPEISVEHATALEMFEAACKRNPEAPAIHYFDATLTFGELDRRATEFAGGLFRRGFSRGDRVAVYLQNVPQFAIAVLGTWKAGGVIVPTSPMYKERELRHQLADSGARFLICHESLYPIAQAVRQGTAIEHIVTTSELEYVDPANLPRLLASSRRFACPQATDLAAFLDEGRGVAVADPEIDIDDVAFLTYTSGTTGVAKGAMNTHRNVVFNTALYREWAQLGETDVVMGLAPLFHITGLIGHLTTALAIGRPLVLFYRFDPAEALRQIGVRKGTFTVASITAFIAMLESPELAKHDLSSFKKVFSGGAPIPPATQARFQAATGIYIHNLYGLTETTSPSHAVPLGSTAPVDAAAGALSVGLPVCNTIVRIVDPTTGRDLPPGEVGELVTKGPMVIPGYWNKEDESAHAIRGGWLYTGDVGKMDENGWFYIVDRSKDMIIASGYKVWPRDVEDVLYQHPAVKEACVIGVPDAYRGQSVKAFVSLRAGMDKKVMPEELIQFCKSRMAAYKYPRAIEFLPELPKTLTGKLLRRELAEREKLRLQSQSRAPVSELQAVGART